MCQDLSIYPAPFAQFSSLHFKVPVKTSTDFVYACTFPLTSSQYRRFVLYSDLAFQTRIAVSYSHQRFRDFAEGRLPLACDLALYWPANASSAISGARYGLRRLDSLWLSMALSLGGQLRFRLPQDCKLKDFDTAVYVMP